MRVESESDEERYAKRVAAALERADHEVTADRVGTEGMGSRGPLVECGAVDLLEAPFGEDRHDDEDRARSARAQWRR